jgi:diazepam-binding inhibitor (GABA receptor modulating acyl-CoA-binding protein)
MPNLENDFQQKAEEVKSLSEMRDDDKLYLYKYYKQATQGDNHTEKPGFFDFVGKAKWNAWESVKGTPKDAAMHEYIMKANELLNP